SMWGFIYLVFLSLGIVRWLTDQRVMTVSNVHSHLLPHSIPLSCHPPRNCLLTRTCNTLHYFPTTVSGRLLRQHSYIHNSNWIIMTLMFHYSLPFKYFSFRQCPSLTHRSHTSRTSGFNFLRAHWG